MTKLMNTECFKIGCKRKPVEKKCFFFLHNVYFNFLDFNLFVVFDRAFFSKSPIPYSSFLFIIFLYQVVKTKERGYTESNPQVSIIGVGYDRTLGGLEMQLRLRDHLARAFNDQKKTPNDVFKNPRSLQKLFKEAGRLKNVLSANTDHVSQVEGLLDDKDFRLPVTREEFEKMCEDLFERVAKPLEMALASAGLSLEHIDQVILVGAGTRVPKVQEKIQAVVKKELGKSLNTDEAAAMGAVYRAADQSPAFKVKKFLVKDAVLYPVQVRRVQRNSENRALIFHIRSGRSRVQRFAHR